MTTTAGSLEIPSGDQRPLPRPRPLQSLVASAQRLTKTSVKGRSSAGSRETSDWQNDAWDMYDLVGEQRFLATTLANRMAQARFYVGRLAESATDEPEPVESGPAVGLLEPFGGTSGLSQIVQRLGVNLFVAGDAWIAGIPPGLMPGAQALPRSLRVSEEEPTFESSGELLVDDLEWRMLSVNEVSTSREGELQLRLGPSEDETITCDPDEVLLLRVWKPHPRRAWEADSPTRSSLPVLRELVGLTMHISAQVDSRLAGAGVLIVPQSAQRALNVAAGLDADSSEDQFTEALLEAMLAPIQDRASASALVPLVVTVPDEAAALFQYLTFAKPLDTEARNLRDEAIRRLALGQDAPPELLLGTGGMNHWGAWLVREDVVTTHIEPPLALICDSLTTQYLWPVLIDQGMSAEEAEQYVIWYDVSHMVMRPNRASEALDLHSRGVISHAALREATGFGDSDAVLVDDETLEISARVALEMGMRDPSLFNSPGLGVIEKQVRALLTGEDVPDPPKPENPFAPPQAADDDEEEEEAQPDVSLPETSDAAPDIEGEGSTEVPAG